MKEEGSLKFTADEARALSNKARGVRENECRAFFDDILNRIRGDAEQGGTGLYVAVPNDLVACGGVVKVRDLLRDLGFEVSSGMGGRYNDVEHYISINW